MRGRYFIIVFLMGIYFINYAGAFGVSYSYLCPDNPIIVPPGETERVYFGMQNMGPDDNKDLNVFVKLKDDGGIATLTESNYIVKANTKTEKFYVDLKVPLEAEYGKKYNIVIDVSVAPSNKDSGVVFGVGNEVNICVLVKEKEIVLSPERGSRKMIWLMVALGILIIAIMVVIIILTLRKKNKNRFRNRRTG